MLTMTECSEFTAMEFLNEIYVWLYFVYSKLISWYITDLTWYNADKWINVHIYSAICVSKKQNQYNLSPVFSSDVPLRAMLLLLFLSASDVLFGCCWLLEMSFDIAITRLKCISVWNKNKENESHSLQPQSLPLSRHLTVCLVTQALFFLMYLCWRKTGWYCGANTLYTPNKIYECPRFIKNACIR